MENQQLKKIFDRYLGNRCTIDEVEMLIRHFNTDSEAYLRQLIISELEQPELEKEDVHLHLLTGNTFELIKRAIGEHERIVIPMHKRAKNLWPRIAVAASFLILLSLTTFFIIRKHTATPKLAGIQNILHDIAPGGNKAVLILSNGKQIDLTNAQNGQLAQEANAIISKTANGKITYSSNGSVAVEAVTYNTLKTPRGGKFDLTLADGTHVWLNAASSITYPSTFNGTNRDVQITGEAYFEVVHNAAKPFRVRVAGQTIEDLGTHFNINAYTDEPSIKATLLEGSIRLTNTNGNITLKPGQQAIVKDDRSITIDEKADMEEAIAWQKGTFMFNNASIEAVMRQLARWYDVEVSYEGKIPQRRFSGKIYCNTSALKVADILSYKQIHFRLEERKIIVIP